MDHHHLAAQAHAQQAVGTARVEGGLIGVEQLEDFDVLPFEGEAGDVAGIGLNQVLGNGVEFRHRYSFGT